jgi:hypothetical protein
MTRFSRPTAALVAVLALLAAAAGLRSSASAQAPPGRTLTLTELERGSTFTHIRNTKGAPQRSNLQGDLIVFTNPLADASGKRVGKISVSCTTTTGARNFLKSTMSCSGVVALGDGTLTMQAIVSPRSPTTAGAVTGGTGAYANARGVFVSSEARGGSKDTITLAG